MIALKKTLLLFVFVLFALCLAGCNDIPDEPVSVYGEPKVTVVINDSKKNKEKDITIFENWSERDRYAQLHYKIEGEASKYDVRIRIEVHHGEDDCNIGEEYKTLSDKIVARKSGKWHNEEIFLATANIYFYRVTLYHGEEILASKTFYTPREEAVYSEVPQEIPEYRPMELSEKEREFYDLCSYAVLDFAKANEYSKIYDIEGYVSADGTKLFVNVIYRPPWTDCLEINLSDKADYSVSYEPYDTEGLESFLSDYYYVLEEFIEKMGN